jgi:hypothetical protein
MLAAPPAAERGHAPPPAVGRALDQVLEPSSSVDPLTPRWPRSPAQACTGVRRRPLGSPLTPAVRTIGAIWGLIALGQGTGQPVSKSRMPLGDDTDRCHLVPADLGDPRSTLLRAHVARPPRIRGSPFTMSTFARPRTDDRETQWCRWSRRPEAG